MRLYGSDKPDLRVKMQFTELTDVMREVEFKVFKAAAELPDGRVAALRVPGGAEMPRSEIDAYTEFVKIYGAKGLAYIKVNETVKGPGADIRQGLQSPIVKNLSDAALAAVLERSGAQGGDLIFFGADRRKIVADALGALRVKIGHSEFGRARGLSQPGWQPLWVIDFPSFEYDEDEHRYVAAHHPFTSPKDGHEDWLETDPARCKAKAYDMVLNGIELGGGSVRIHRADVQEKVFHALKIGPARTALEVRLPARCAAVRCAAARRHRPGPRSLRDADGRRRFAARRHRVPEDAARAGSAHAGAGPRRRAPVARAAHPPAQRRAQGQRAAHLSETERN